MRVCAWRRKRRAVRCIAVDDDHPSSGAECCRRDAVRLPGLRRLLVGLQRGRKEHRRDYIHRRCDRSWCNGTLRKPGPDDLQDRARLGDRRGGPVDGRRKRRIEAPMVVLAAGTLGTTELLLRAKQRGLSSRQGWVRSFQPTATTSYSRAISKRRSTPFHGVSVAGAAGVGACGAPQHGADRPRR